eukprot:TRINITY_DN11698_c0_g1_i1.p1 TRINITY_DN11698_c0_g1~~TRINITY_DN11698_c0_g1_i1.p1  ORF type:complete len:843 (-),score=181.34 TRINITY_DN11698_c0_g1_i1:13-2541(-)
MFNEDPEIGFIINLHDEDIPYEEDVIRNPYSLKSWWRYLQLKSTSPAGERNMIYERALQKLPGSYKLWFNYLTERRGKIEQLRVDHPAYSVLESTFERALIFMHKYPRIWVEYLHFLMKQGWITKTRRAFNRALMSLPVTQHNRIWPVFIEFVKHCDVPETAIRVFRRYLKLDPDNIEEFIDYLIISEEIDEAVKQLTLVLNDDSFKSKKKRSKHDMWMMLCDLISQYPGSIKTVRVEPIIRSGLQKFSNEIGTLWSSLAKYYIILKNYAKARDVFEEGISSVLSMRDFSLIWEAYSNFEQKFITDKLNRITELEQSGKFTKKDQEDFELCMMRYEDLFDRQAIMISNVKLRQNPHNVNEWLKRMTLFDDPSQIVEEFSQALRTVDPMKATGKPQNIWINFANFWEEYGKVEEARAVYQAATRVNFKKLDHIASVWSSWVEMELRQGNFQYTRKLLQIALTPPKDYRSIDNRAPTIRRVFKSTRLWHLYADIEESLGTFLSTKAVYDKILDLKIASPLTILSYANFLRENNYFEESFKVYERGVSVFKFPHVMDIWVMYIKDFTERYGGSKMERLRDMFEQALDDAPEEFCTILFYMFAECEEKYGMARRAMLIYDRAVRKVPNKEKPKMYNLYLQRATENFGITRTRKIFEKAIENLKSKYVKEFGLRYAKLESRLGEIDRARGIYCYIAQFCPVDKEPEFWELWKKFEVKHGNSDTVKEMFRIRRSVIAQYNISLMHAQNTLKSGNEMQRLEAQNAPQQDEEIPSLVDASAVPEYENNEEIDIDMDFEIAPTPHFDQPETEPEDDFIIEEREVPSAVFGSAAAEYKGARDRLKKKKAETN